MYVPDLPEQQRWVHFDPTNDRVGWYGPGEDCVLLACGRDFSDVSPMRGVIHGGASHTLTVGVTVEPVPTVTANPGQTQSQTQSQSALPGQSQYQDSGQSQAAIAFLPRRSA